MATVGEPLTLARGTLKMNVFATPKNITNTLNCIDLSLFHLKITYF